MFMKNRKTKLFRKKQIFNSLMDLKKENKITAWILTGKNCQEKRQGNFLKKGKIPKNIMFKPQ